MARPLKDGVDYFPKDTDFYNDDKIRILKAEFKAKGMYILDYILCEIYGKDGYFMRWDKSKGLLLSDAAGCDCSPGFINEFILGCIRCSFFDKRVYESFGVLTSAGIQRRYMRMLNNRKGARIIKEYWLLDCTDETEVPSKILDKIVFKSVSSIGNPVIRTGNPVKRTRNPQNKIKENKIKENKINNGKKSVQKNSQMRTFDASEFDKWENYEVPDFSKKGGDKK